MTKWSSSSSTTADEIERYLRTGDADILVNPWPGDIMERGRRRHADIRGALLEKVRRTSKGRTHEAVPDNVGVAFMRAKVERDIVLATIEKSVDYVTSDTIESILLKSCPTHRG